MHRKAEKNIPLKVENQNTMRKPEGYDRESQESRVFCHKFEEKTIKIN
jgi:hypothetical protein